MKFLRPAILAAALALFATTASAVTPLPLDHRWFYLQTNLARPENVDHAAKIFAEAEKDGFNGVFIIDSKFAQLKTQPAAYFTNIERFKKAAADHHLEIIPGVFPTGWSNDILANDPNLAEGMPVKDALFIVKNGEATIQQDPAITLKGDNFQDLKAWETVDPSVTYDPAEKAARFGGSGRSRIMQKIKVSPQREYRFTVRIKTKNYKGDAPVLQILTDGTKGPKNLSLQNWQIPPTSNWKTYTLVFNSAGYSDVTVYLGTWGSKSGNFWMTDAKIEEPGLLNVLRRPGAPLTVKTDAGKLLVEGKAFAPIADPKLGQIPWAGEYDTAHEAPPIKILSNLPDNTRLRVSYYHPMIIYSSSVMLCPSEPKTLELLTDQADRINKLFHPKSFFMAHDEIRFMNWDEACQSRHLTPGQILADNIQSCQQILKKLNPKADIYIWGDMVDPNHNAHDNYMLINGDLKGSWKGLDKDTIVVPWYFDQRVNSIKFFAGLGNRMLLSVFVDNGAAPAAKWLDAAAPFPDKIVGVMYTTWADNYKNLDAFAKVIAPYKK